MLNVVVESAKSSTATVGDWLNQWCEFGAWLCIYYTNIEGNLFEKNRCSLAEINLVYSGLLKRETSISASKCHLTAPPYIIHIRGPSSSASLVSDSLHLYLELSTK